MLFRYNIANCRERRVVIVESVVTPTRIRHLLADILLKQFEVCLEQVDLYCPTKVLFFARHHLLHLFHHIWVQRILWVEVLRWSLMSVTQRRKLCQ